MVVSSRQERALAARDGIEAGATRPAALVPGTFLEAQAFCAALASSDLVPAKLKDRAADVLVIVLSGIEVGLAPMQSLRLYHVINGVPRLSADGMAAVVSASPLCEYLEVLDSTEARSTWRTKKRGRGEQTLTWTIEKAKGAGLLTDPRSKDRWTAYPGAMLNARCKAELCRLVYPEVVAGLYSTEEARDGAIDAEFTEVPRVTNFIAPPVAPAPVPEQARRPRSVRPRDAAPIEIEPALPEVSITTTTYPTPAPVPALDPVPAPTPEPPRAAPPEPPPPDPAPHNGADADIAFGEVPHDAANDGSIAEFTTWLMSCRTKQDLRLGRDKWIAWSRRHYAAGSEQSVAMQQAFARRNAEVP
jgi:hypothetical protein